MATFYAQLSFLESEMRRLLHKPSAALITVGRALIRIDAAAETAEETSPGSRAMTRCSRLRLLCLEMVQAELDWDRSREVTSYHARCVAARRRILAGESSEEGVETSADDVFCRVRRVRFVEPAHLGRSCKV